MRREQYCDGRLVKEIDQINVGGEATESTDRHVDGSHRWLLDGEEITPAEAAAFLATWEAGTRGRRTS